VVIYRIMCYHSLAYTRPVHYVSFPLLLQQFTGEKLLEFYFVYQAVVISYIVSITCYSFHFSSLLPNSPAPSVCYVIFSVLMVMHKDSHPFTTSGRPKSSWRSLWMMPLPFPPEVEIYQMLSYFVCFSYVSEAIMQLCLL